MSLRQASVSLEKAPIKEKLSRIVLIRGGGRVIWPEPKRSSFRLERGFQFRERHTSGARAVSIRVNGYSIAPGSPGTNECETWENEWMFFRSQHRRVTRDQDSKSPRNAGNLCQKARACLGFLFGVPTSTAWLGKTRCSKMRWLTLHCLRTPCSDSPRAIDYRTVRSLP